MSRIEHSPRCAVWNKPPDLRDARDCDCGAIPSVYRDPRYDELMATANVAIAQRDAAVHWIVMHIVANEHVRDALPTVLKGAIARELVSNPFMGWPNIEAARQHLEETFRWVD